MDFAFRIEQGCLIIAEIAQAHDGSLGFAHAYIDAAADAGADAVKFQTHIAAAESSPAEPWRVRFSRQDATRYDYWRRMEFSEEQWAGLRAHAEERGLFFLSSPFSVEAAELLLRVGVKAWKLASGEIANPMLSEFLRETRLPVLLSTGMSPVAEIDRAVQFFRRSGTPPVVMQCTSEYPCPPERVGLNLIPWYRERYACRVGLSDHSGAIYAGLAAAALGINALEVHLTLSRHSFGPDVAASVTVEELRMLVEGVRAIETMRRHPVDKDGIAADMQPMRSLFTKSIFARMDLPEGTILSTEHLALRKPGAGIPGDRLPEILGRRLRRAVPAGEMIPESALTAERQVSEVA